MNMGGIIASVASGIAIIGLVLFGWRQLDHRKDREAGETLVRLGTASAPETFDLSMVSDLPEPARRYFAFAIAPGTPLSSAVRITMSGELGNGTKADPKYQPMRASQILAPPHGLVWTVTAGLLSGSDGAMPDSSWTRFWLLDVLPVVRANGSDHQRSAFGRVIAEAAIWAPVSLLPSEYVRWQSVGENTARAIVEYKGFTQAVDITVDPDGAPTAVLIQRWSNENPAKQFREQPFGGMLSQHRTFGGYTLPTHVEGGNHFGTPDYFPFFKVDVLTIEAVGPSG